VKAGIEKSKKKKAAQDVFDKDSHDEIADDMFILCLNLSALIYVNLILVKKMSSF